MLSHTPPHRSIHPPQDEFCLTWLKRRVSLTCSSSFPNFTILRCSDCPVTLPSSPLRGRGDPSPCRGRPPICSSHSASLILTGNSSQHSSSLDRESATFPSSLLCKSAQGFAFSTAPFDQHTAENGLCHRIADRSQLLQCVASTPPPRSHGLPSQPPGTARSHHRALSQHPTPEVWHFLHSLKKHLPSAFLQWEALVKTLNPLLSLVSADKSGFIVHGYHNAALEKEAWSWSPTNFGDQLWSAAVIYK